MKHIKAFLAYVLAEFGIYENSVCLGFCGDLHPEKVHGVARVHLIDKGSMIIPFTVDKPSALDHPSASILLSLFNQLSKLGMCPQSIELRTDMKTRVFVPNRTKPIITQMRAVA